MGDGLFTRFSKILLPSRTSHAHLISSAKPHTQTRDGLPILFTRETLILYDFDAHPDDKISRLIKKGNHNPLLELIINIFWKKIP